MDYGIIHTKMQKKTRYISLITLFTVFLIVLVPAAIANDNDKCNEECLKQVPKPLGGSCRDVSANAYECDGSGACLQYTKIDHEVQVIGPAEGLVLICSGYKLFDNPDNIIYDCICYNSKTCGGTKDNCLTQCKDGGNCKCAGIGECADYGTDLASCKSNTCTVGDGTASYCKEGTGGKCDKATSTALTCKEACKPIPSECSTEDLVTKYAATKDVTKNTGGTCATGDCYCLKDKGAGTGTGDSDVISKIKTAVYKIVMTLYCLVLYIVSTVAALFVVLTGIKYMFSNQADSRSESRRRMVYALAGLIVIYLACPLINILFAGTNIGIPNDSGGKDACPGCPIMDQIMSGGGSLGGAVGGGLGGGGLGGGGLGGGYVGGGDSGGSWYTSQERHKQSEGFTACATTATCPTGYVCAQTAGEGFRCFPKIADGYSISASDLEAQSGIKTDLCMTGSAPDGDICGTVGCANTAGCKGKDAGKYCSKDGFCADKLGEQASCGSSLMKANTDDPDLMCSSGWCTSEGCRPTDTCFINDDCTVHNKNTYCNDNDGACQPRVDKEGMCKASWVKDGNANLVCKTGFTCTNEICK